MKKLLFYSLVLALFSISFPLFALSPMSSSMLGAAVANGAIQTGTASNPSGVGMAKGFIEDKDNKNTFNPYAVEGKVQSSAGSQKRDFNSAPSPIEAMFNSRENTSLAFSLKGSSPAEYKASVDYPSVADTTGASYTLSGASQFGYDIFNQAQALALNLTDVPVGKDYILGPGDTLNIRIWGKIEEAFSVTIDQNGRAYFPKLGYMGLSGLSLERATFIIQKELEKFYINFQITITLDHLRSIKVFVLGNVNIPGAYDVSSLTTAFMLLYQAGGPTKMGTLRKIQIRRNNRVIHTLDLYQYLLKGDRAEDIRLEANDTIFVPPIGGVVKIVGTVKRPGIFEVSDQATLQDVLVNFAAGLPAGSYHKRIQVDRIVNGEKSQVLDLTFASLDELKKDSSKYFINDGDSISVFSIDPTEKNIVSIEGNVFRSGRFQLKPGMTLQDLITLADGLKEKTYLPRIEVLRYISDSKRSIVVTDHAHVSSFKLKEQDIVKIFSEDDVLGNQFIEINGAVQSPGIYKLLDNMTLSDLLFTAKISPYTPVSYIEIFRKLNTLEERCITVDVNALLKEPQSDKNIQLMHQDRIFVRLDNTKEIRRVTMSGYFVNPGIYLAREGETITSLIKRAGGYKSNAFPKGMVFFRTSVKTQLGEAQARVLGEEKKRLIFDQTRLAVLSEKNQHLYETALNFLEDKIKTSSGRIVVHLQEDGKTLEPQDNLTLQDGDELTVPPISNTVQVVGGVQQPIAVTYSTGKPLKYYIEQVGGYSDYADKSTLYVFKPNGTIQVNPSLVEVGDSIYVPEVIRLYFDWFDYVSKLVQLTFNLVSTYSLLHR